MEHLSNDLSENEVQVVLAERTAGEKSMPSGFYLGLHLISNAYYDRVGKNDWSAAYIDELLFFLEKVAFGSHKIFTGIGIGLVDFREPLIEGVIEGLGIDE